MGFRDEALAAVKAAARESYRAAPTRLEAQVVAAVERHIRTRRRREHRDDLVEGWRRQPGGVDLAIVDLEGRARVLMEMKVEKLDESLWDVLKLAALHRYEHVDAAFLVYEGRRAVFEGSGDCAALFQKRVHPEDGTATWATEDLIRQWPRAWAGLLRGGYGNGPSEAPAEVVLELALTVPALNYPGREIRVIEVGPGGGALIHFDDDGWPPGVAIAAPPLSRACQT